MPSSSVETPLRDILHHIDLAMQFAAGFDYEDIAPRYVWETLERDLPPLRIIVERELSWSGDPA